MKTNKEFAKDMNTTERQISKSRKRGFITTVDGVVKQFKAPLATHISKAKNGVVRYTKGGVKKWTGGTWDGEKAIFTSGKATKKGK